MPQDQDDRDLRIRKIMKRLQNHPNEDMRFLLEEVKLLEEKHSALKERHKKLIKEFNDSKWEKHLQLREAAARRF